jgi:hypothetical protein
MMELLNPMSKADFPAYTATAGASAGPTTAWSAGPQGVLVWADVACYVEVGVGAVATTASTPIPANTPIPFVLQLSTNGSPWRVSVLRIGSTDGIAYCKPINKQ